MPNVSARRLAACVALLRRTRDTNRSRARGRHDLGRRTRRWQGSVYSDAEVIERDG